MEFKNKAIIISGAGGLGSMLAKNLVRRELKKLVIIDVDESGIDTLIAEIYKEFGMENKGLNVTKIVADLSKPSECIGAIEESIKILGNVDMLINTAGLNSFGLYGEESNSKIDLMIKVNLTAPMIMSNCIVPHMKNNRSGQIVNIGSIFGSVGFACFATYSATKFGLRGFSEALRRELHDDGISIVYIAPRAVETKMNNESIIEMGKATGMNMDKPEDVVNKIISSIINDSKESYFGATESFLVRLNSIFPRLGDLILRGNDRISKRFASIYHCNDKH